MNNVNTSVATALITLLENGGRLANDIYTGAAYDKDRRQFLIRDYHYPVGFTVDDKGNITLNGERVKGASKFQPGNDKSVKDTFNDYCTNLGLEGAFFFQVSTIEKAMTIAMLNNVARNLQQSNGEMSEQELLQETVASTLSQLSKVVSEAPSNTINDEDSLACAMMAAGMTPMRNTQQPEETFSVEQVRKVEDVVDKGAKVLRVSDEEDLVRSERLIHTLRNNGELNQAETEMLEHLEELVDRKRTKQETLKAVINDRSSLCGFMRSHMLSGLGTPIGLHNRYVA